MPPVLEASAAAAADPADLHVVFSAECIPAFDWQSAGLFYSFRRVQQPGRITRLLACSEAQLSTYPKVNLEMGPTFVHKNMRFDASNDAEKDDPHNDGKGTGYASYNKPYSVMAWLEQTDVEEDYVLFMDSDMILRQPIDPVAMGVTRGNVVSAEYTYLYGTKSGFAHRFIDPKLDRRMAQVGGFHIFHREDLRQIAPKWLTFTQRVRQFANDHPEEYFNESAHHPDPPKNKLEGETWRKQARWHGEMYGYVFAAAEVGVTHRIRRDIMLYPGYEPHLGRPPFIMHYGADYTLGRAYFNKMNYQQLRLEECSHALAKPSGSLFLLDDPEVDLEAMSKRDALCQEHLSTLNAAFCEFYQRACAGKLLPERCRTFAAQIDEVQPRISACVDEHENCAGWGLAECGKNPMYMHSKCPVTCQSCGKSGSELVPSEVHYGDWKYDERLQAERLQQVAEVVASASEEELVEIEGKVAARRTELRQIKHEL